MTWFGIVLVIYYVLNIIAGIFYVGKGGIVSTRGSIILSICFSVFFIIGLLTVGTNA